MKKEHKIGLGIAIAAIAGGLIWYFWDNIKALFSGSGTSSSSSSGRMSSGAIAVSDIPARYQNMLTDAEKKILATLYANVNRLSLADADPNQVSILVNKANDQLNSIGSKLSISAWSPGQVQAKPCPCSGWTINLGIFTFRHCVRDC